MKKRASIDREYIRNASRTTPKQRMEWLAAAWDFTNATKLSRRVNSARGKAKKS